MDTRCDWPALLASLTKCLYVLCLGGSLPIYGQDFADTTVYRSYDQLIGEENTGLYNGPHFEDENIYAYDDSHIFLKSRDFVNGYVEYAGQAYTQVFLKYDLLEDFLITGSDDHLSLFKVRMIPDKISGFALHGHHFVRLDHADFDLEGNGYFELALQEGSTALYIKHRKQKRRKTINRVLQYYFVSDNIYVLYHEEAYHLIEGVKDFKAFVPNQYNAIKSYRKKFKDLYKSDRDQFMKGLVHSLITPYTESL